MPTITEGQQMATKEKAAAAAAADTETTDETTSVVEAGEAMESSAPAEPDRVAMISFRADGTPDQVDPELIGDKADALAATTAQLVGQAEGDDVAAAKKAAEKLVDELHKG